MSVLTAPEPEVAEQALERDATQALVRALARRPDVAVQVTVSGVTALCGAAPLTSNGFRPTPTTRVAWRAATDALAFRLRFSDDALHRAMAPESAEARWLHEACEQLRVEALGARRYPGARANLRAERHRFGAQGLESSPATTLACETALPLLAAEWGLAPSEDTLCPPRVAAAVRDAARHADNQALFTRSVAALSRVLGAAWQVRESLDAEKDEHAATPPSDSLAPTPDPLPAPGVDASDALPMGVEDGAADGLGPATPSDFAGRSLRLLQPDRPPAAAAYRPYCVDFDQVVPAHALVDSNALTALRRQLDEVAATVPPALTRLAHRLQRLLLAHRPSQWQFDLDDGLLDSGRIARVVARPLTPLAFKAELAAPSLDTVVSLLIDNSGSMRGRPIANAAVCVEILAAALERCGVRVEVLGFTTRSWNGGQSSARWVSNGKPASPGRLGDLRHIVYKAADEPLRRARRSFGAMLAPDLLKENVDGEALLWAAHRLASRSESRRILIVISDGSPAEQATEAANSPEYLERHLEEVVRRIRHSGTVELLAIGIGYDVSRHYPESVTIADELGLGESLGATLMRLFEQARPGAIGRARAAHRDRARSLR